MKVLLMLALLGPSIASAYCDQYGNCLTGGAVLVAPNGQYLGNLNANPYDPNSVANPYGRYGSPYSAQSVNNPYSRWGSPYMPGSATNPYSVGRGVRVYGE